MSIFGLAARNARKIREEKEKQELEQKNNQIQEETQEKSNENQIDEKEPILQQQISKEQQVLDERNKSIKKVKNLSTNMNINNQEGTVNNMLSLNQQQIKKYDAQDIHSSDTSNQSSFLDEAEEEDIKQVMDYKRKRFQEQEQKRQQQAQQQQEKQNPQKNSKKFQFLNKDQLQNQDRQNTQSDYGKSPRSPGTSDDLYQSIDNNPKKSPKKQQFSLFRLLSKEIDNATKPKNFKQIIGKIGQNGKAYDQESQYQPKKNVTYDGEIRRGGILNQFIIKKAKQQRYAEVLEKKYVNIKNGEDGDALITAIQKITKTDQEIAFITQIFKNLDIFNQSGENSEFRDKMNEIFDSQNSMNSLLRGVRYKFCKRRQVLFNIGDVGTTYYIIISGSVYCLVPHNKNISSSNILKESTETDPEKIEIQNKEILEIQRLKSQDSDSSSQQFKQEINYDNFSNETYLRIKYPDFTNVFTYSTGQGFGDIALLTHSNRTATMVMKEDTHLLTLTKTVFEKIFESKQAEFMNEQVSFLNNFPFFSEIQSSFLISHIISETDIKTYKSKEAVYSEGDDSDFYYFIKKGEVNLSKQVVQADDEFSQQNLQMKNFAVINSTQQSQIESSQIRRITYAHLSENTFFGEEEIYKKQEKRESKAVVYSNYAQIYVIPKEKLHSLLQFKKKMPIFQEHVEQKLQRHEKQLRKFLQTKTFSSITQLKAQKILEKSAAISQKLNIEKCNELPLNTLKRSALKNAHPLPQELRLISPIPHQRKYKQKNNTVILNSSSNAINDDFMQKSNMQKSNNNQNNNSNNNPQLSNFASSNFQQQQQQQQQEDQQYTPQKMQKLQQSDKQKIQLLTDFLNQNANEIYSNDNQKSEAEKYHQKVLSMPKQILEIVNAEQIINQKHKQTLLNQCQGDKQKLQQIAQELKQYEKNQQLTEQQLDVIRNLDLKHLHGNPRQITRFLSKDLCEHWFDAENQGQNQEKMFKNSVNSQYNIQTSVQQQQKLQKAQSSFPSQKNIQELNEKNQKQKNKEKIKKLLTIDNKDNQNNNSNNQELGKLFQKLNLQKTLKHKKQTNSLSLNLSPSSYNQHKLDKLPLTKQDHKKLFQNSIINDISKQSKSNINSQYIIDVKSDKISNFNEESQQNLNSINFIKDKNLSENQQEQLNILKSPSQQQSSVQLNPKCVISAPISPKNRSQKSDEKQKFIKIGEAQSQKNSLYLPKYQHKKNKSMGNTFTNFDIKQQNLKKNMNSTNYSVFAKGLESPNNNYNNNLLDINQMQKENFIKSNTFRSTFFSNKSLNQEENNLNNNENIDKNNNILNDTIINVQNTYNNAIDDLQRIYQYKDGKKIGKLQYFKQRFPSQNHLFLQNIKNEKNEKEVIFPEFIKENLTIKNNFPNNKSNLSSKNQNRQKIQFPSTYTSQTNSLQQLEALQSQQYSLKVSSSTNGTVEQYDKEIKNQKVKNLDNKINNLTQSINFYKQKKQQRMAKSQVFHNNFNNTNNFTTNNTIKGNFAKLSPTIKKQKPLTANDLKIN